MTVSFLSVFLYQTHESLSETLSLSDNFSLVSLSDIPDILHIDSLFQDDLNEAIITCF